MKQRYRLLLSFSVAVIGHVALSAQASSGAQQPSTPPTTASAEVTACSQAQKVVDQLLVAANARIEQARQSNNPTDMRAAIDALQTTIRDVRAQLAPCANAAAVDPHAGHAKPGESNMPGMTNMPGMKLPEPDAADPHAGHAAPPATDPHAGRAMPPPATAKPPAANPHAGHSMPMPKREVPTNKSPIKPPSPRKPA